MLGVGPLSWSHAEVVAALTEYLEKRCSLLEREGKIQHLHLRGRYADRYMAPHDWEARDGHSPDGRPRTPGR
jgi:hypothetical protein